MDDKELKNQLREGLLDKYFEKREKFYDKVDPYRSRPKRDFGEMKMEFRGILGRISEEIGVELTMEESDIVLGDVREIKIFVNGVQTGILNMFLRGAYSFIGMNPRLLGKYTEDMNELVPIIKKHLERTLSRKWLFMNNQ